MDLTPTFGSPRGEGWDIAKNANRGKPLARAGDDLVSRLVDVSSNNGELRKRLDMQAREITQLMESGRAQQQQYENVDRRIDEARSCEARAVESRVRAEASAVEVQLRSEVQALKGKAQRERDELLRQIQRHEADCAQSERERDEARAQTWDLEAKLSAALAAPAFNQARVAAVEKEMGLVRARLAKEVAAREAADQAAVEARAQHEHLQASLSRGEAELKQLRRQVAEQAEQIAYREEVYSDLQTQLQTQRLDGERRLHAERLDGEQRVGYERARREATERLDCVLPRGILDKAWD